MKLTELKPLNESAAEVSADELLELITKAYRRMLKYRDSYQSFEKITTIYELLREPLMKDNVGEYNKVRDYAAGKYPDAYDEFFDEVALAGQ